METAKIERILVAVDGSDNAVRAAQVAAVLAEKFNAELIVCHAVETPFRSFAQHGISFPKNLLDEYLTAARGDAKKIVDKVIQTAVPDRVKTMRVIQENVFSVVEAIVNLAEERKVDLIVIGTRGQTGFKKLVVGSVSSGVISRAACPVLVVR
jgi:nucleotide-binding universal stress UspA family protein